MATARLNRTLGIAPGILLIVYCWLREPSGWGRLLANYAAVARSTIPLVSEGDFPTYDTRDDLGSGAA